MTSKKYSFIKKYNSTRPKKCRKLLCYAPFTNMYFNVHGDAAPCWLGFIDPDSYPEKSINEIWHGERFNEFRRNIENLKLKETCGTCLDNLNKGNYVSVLAKAYDHLGEPGKYPKMMELELDNTCNLECIMCNGTLSSSIRKNREKKPPLHIPYDDTFVEQLNEFIPHLQELRINGGEPFLSKICIQVFENVVRINPGIKLVVATNGTILSDNIKALLEKGRFHINLSIDSLSKDTYEKIRVNAEFEKTRENFQYFVKYCRKKKTKLCLLVNPMRQNWREMGDFVKFCNKYNIPLWFNTIRYPEEHSLWALPAEQLQEIYDSLSAIRIKPRIFAPESFHNIKIFNNLVNRQIYQWLQESQQKKENKFENEDFDAEKAFYEQMEKYIAEDAGSEAEVQKQIQIIHAKIDTALSSPALTKMSRKGFYKLAGTMPVAMVYRELMSKSNEELVALIEKYGD